MSNYPNPNVVSGVASGWNVDLFGSTNAAFQQKVVITQGTTTATFTGGGEGVPMVDSSGNQVFTFSSDGGDITLTFYESKDNGGSYSESQVARFTPGGGSSIKFWEYGTEDYDDGDNNDTVFTVTATNHA